MNLVVLLNALIMGVLLGGLYGLMVVGLNLVYGVMKIFNLAHQEFIVLGAYTAFWMWKLFGVDPFLSIGLCAPLFFVIGLFLFKFGIYPLLKLRVREAEKSALVLFLLFGVMIFIQGMMLNFWTTNVRSIKTEYAYAVPLASFGIMAPLGWTLAFVVCSILFVLTYFVIEKTEAGMTLRAVIQDKEAAMLMGVNTERVLLLSFAASVALAAVSGAPVGLVIPIYPYLGYELLVKLFAIAILGGLGSVMGGFLGAILVGLVEGILTLFIKSTYVTPIVYLLMIIILIMRPKGIIRKGD